MSRKRKNRIDVRAAVELMKEAYGFKVEILNFYQIRVRQEETDAMYDWFHTTGTLTVLKDGFCKRLAVIMDADRVSEFIKNHISQ